MQRLQLYWSRINTALKIGRYNSAKIAVARNFKYLNLTPVWYHNFQSVSFSHKLAQKSMGKIQLVNIEKSQLPELLRQLDTVTNGACLDDLNNEQVLDKQLELVELHANIVTDCEKVQLPLKCWVDSFTSTCEDPEMTDIELPFSDENSMVSNIRKPFVDEMKNMTEQAIELWANQQPGPSRKTKQVRPVDRSMLSIFKMKTLAESKKKNESLKEFKIKAKVKKEKKNIGMRSLVDETPGTSNNNTLLRNKRKTEWQNDITNTRMYYNFN